MNPYETPMHSTEESDGQVLYEYLYIGYKGISLVIRNAYEWFGSIEEYPSLLISDDDSLPTHWQVA